MATWDGHREAMTRDYLLHGIEPGRIAADFGVTTDALGKQFRRAGVDDLACVFENVSRLSHKAAA